MTAKPNDQVKVHYTGKLTTGEVFDSSTGRAPLAFVVGSGQMIKGFDDAVQGMSLMEKKTVTIPSQEAYGAHRPELIQEIAREQLPPDMNPEVGQKLVATDGSGQQTQVLVTEVSEKIIVVDGNHDLAGKDLIFDIELVEIS
ncbi:MAG: peptidylprolyl isomerase [Bacteroidota bacterium]